MLRFYCEYLEAIRVASVDLWLASPWDYLTKIRLFDRRHLCVRHGFQSFVVALPCSADEELLHQELEPIVGEDKKYVRLRFKAAPVVIRRVRGNDSIPFGTATQLQSSDLSCRLCQRHLITHDAELTWRALPSEHWAEMMDSWHCHRGLRTSEKAPRDGNQRFADRGVLPTDVIRNELHEQHVLPSELVSAVSRISPANGVGLAGFSYLLVRLSSMLNVVVDAALVLCDCGAIVGSVDAGVVRLQKVSLDHSKHLPRSILQAQELSITYLTHDILAKLEAHSTRRFLIEATDDMVKRVPLLVWVMNTDVQLSYGTNDCCDFAHTGRSACKVLYRHAGAQRARECSDGHPDWTLLDGAESLEIPSKEFDALERDLLEHTQISGNQLYPLDGFEWHASFLLLFPAE
ncbi:hypothetical protein PYCC9005_000285 [Savitreella phatthalungensis]